MDYPGSVSMDSRTSHKKQSTEYPPKTIRFISFVFIAIGVCCIGMQIATIVLHSYMSEISCGIWGGFFLVLAGVVGVFSADKKTSGWILAFMLMCFINMLIAILLLVQCSLGIDRDRSEHRTLKYRGTNLDEPFLATNCVRVHPFDCQYGWGYDVEWQKRGYDRKIKKLEASLVLNSIMIVFSLIVFCLSVWAAVLCWIARSGEQTVDENVFYSTTTPTEKPPMAYINNGAQFSPASAGLERSFDSFPSDYSQLSSKKPSMSSIPPDYSLAYTAAPRNSNWSGTGDLGQAQVQHSTC